MNYNSLSADWFATNNYFFPFLSFFFFFLSLAACLASRSCFNRSPIIFFSCLNYELNLKNRINGEIVMKISIWIRFWWFHQLFFKKPYCSKLSKSRASPPSSSKSSSSKLKWANGSPSPPVPAAANLLNFPKKMKPHMVFSSRGRFYCKFLSTNLKNLKRNLNWSKNWCDQIGT